MDGPKGAPDRAGWHVLPVAPQGTMRDGPFDCGRLVATVEAFGDRGPWYDKAGAPDGTSYREGPSLDHAAATGCERVAGGAAQRGTS